MDVGRGETEREPYAGVVTVAAPPGRSGQARVLEQLLGAWPVGRRLILSENLPDIRGEEGLGTPPGFVHLPQPPRRPILGRLGSLGRTLAFELDVRGRARAIAEALQKAGVEVLVGCSGGHLDLASAAVGAWRVGVPLVACLFDDPVFQWGDEVLRARSLAWERWWAVRAAAVMVPNECLARDFEGRTGCATTIVRNAVSDLAFAEPGRKWPRREGAPARIVYTGSVYHAQADAIRNLLEALRALGGEFVLEIYSSQGPDELVRQGIEGPYVSHQVHLDGDEVFRVQKEADVVFLPLGFATGIPEVIRSSAPGKTGEYLASGTPVLVHAPRQSWISEFFRERGLGEVVDAPEPVALREALRRIAGDPGRRNAGVAAARRAAEEFRVEVARDTFRSVVRNAAKVDASGDGGRRDSVPPWIP